MFGFYKGFLVHSGMKNTIVFLKVGEDTSKSQSQRMFVIPAARRSNMALGNLLRLFIYYHNYQDTKLIL